MECGLLYILWCTFSSAELSAFQLMTGIPTYSASSRKYWLATVSLPYFSLASQVKLHLLWHPTQCNAVTPVCDIDHAGDVLAEELVADLAQHLGWPRHRLQHLYEGLELEASLQNRIDIIVM